MWLSKVVFISILYQCCVYTSAQVSKRFFRNDYTYVESTESFYKIHTLHKTWLNAKRICAMEGATLFYPEDNKEADAMTHFLNSTQPFHWLYVGASDILSKGVYETIDGVPVSDTYHNWAPGEPNDGHPQNCVTLRRDATLNDENCALEYPFACKKTLSSLEWNQPCNMPFKDYEFDEATGRCYKFHLKPQSWSNAYAACSAELSYLAVINSPTEADILVNLTAKAPKDHVSGDYLRGAIHLGFQNFASDEGWLTVKGVPLNDSGYSHWSKGEPNNADAVNGEHCGSMYYNGKLNDIGCQKRCFFICEHDVEATFDERFLDDANMI